MICMWSSWCHCHPIISCSSKIQNDLAFWCHLTQIVTEKRPLNGCSYGAYMWRFAGLSYDASLFSIGESGLAFGWGSNVIIRYNRTYSYTALCLVTGGIIIGLSNRLRSVNIAVQSVLCLLSSLTLILSIHLWVCGVCVYICQCVVVSVQDCGCIQLCATGKLKPYICSDPVTVRPVENRVPSLVMCMRVCMLLIIVCKLQFSQMRMTVAFVRLNVTRIWIVTVIRCCLFHVQYTIHVHSSPLTSLSQMTMEFTLSSL